MKTDKILGLSYKLLLGIGLLLAVPFVGLCAQDDDFGIGVGVKAKKKFTRDFAVSADGEFRTQDGLNDVERWTIGAGAAYRITSWLKSDAGYSFIYKRKLSEVTRKGNIVSPYWSPRHRLHLSLNGEVKWNRVEFSLRERYQYTYRASRSVPKFDGDDGSPKADEEITGKGENMLRSRLQAKWKIRKSGFEPFASCELYHCMSNSWKLDKTRFTVGTDYEFDKTHSLEISYRYQNRSDDDESSGHLLSVGYAFTF